MKYSFFVSALLAAFLCASSYAAPNARRAAQSDGSPSRQAPAQSAEAVTVAIPGPLRSFLRMAGISQKTASEEVLPLRDQEGRTEGTHLKIVFAPSRLQMT